MLFACSSCSSSHKQISSDVYDVTPDGTTTATFQAAADTNVNSLHCGWAAGSVCLLFTMLCSVFSFILKATAMWPYVSRQEAMLPCQLTCSCHANTRFQCSLAVFSQLICVLCLSLFPLPNSLILSLFLLLPLHPLLPHAPLVVCIFTYWLTFSSQNHLIISFPQAIQKEKKVWNSSMTTWWEVELVEA